MGLEGDAYENLIKWGIVDENEKQEEYLDYDYLYKTMNRLLPDNNYKIVPNSEMVDRETAIRYIDKAVASINNQSFKEKFEVKEKEEVIKLDDYTLLNDSLKCDKALKINDYIYLQDEGSYKKIIGYRGDYYAFKDVSFEEIIAEIEISDSFEIDFENAEIISPETEKEAVYFNEDRQLLSSTLLSNTFCKDGYRISYSFKSNSLSARISKEINKKNVFLDISVSGIKPSFKWKYQDGNVLETYMKIDFKSSEELGVSDGTYKNYYLDLKNEDGIGFKKFINSKLRNSEEDIETTIKICEIKTPLPNIPSAYFNIDVLAKIYTSGKVELLLQNNHSLGFEVKNGVFRVINDTDRDLDFKIGASSKAALGLNFNLEASKYRLMDIELDGGIRAAVSSTMHIYDKEGDKTEEASDIPYSVLDEVARENEDVKICGDLSLNWIMDINFNTSKSLLSKFGFSASKTILDAGDQIFDNYTHIENMALVKKCTRKAKYKTNVKDFSTNVEKIILEKYSKVIKIGETTNVPIRLLPKDMSEKDLIYTSSNNEVAIVNESGLIIGLKRGSSLITISSKDNKYSTQFDILVSD